MTDESVSATRVIDAAIGAVFAVLCDPTRHAAIDGTGWVGEALDTAPLTSPGQIFRVRMFHADHPEGHYEMENEVLVLEAPYAVSWRPGYRPDGHRLIFEGWVWRYDLTPLTARRTRVTLSYDWSQVGPGPRTELDFPPFPIRHLEDSLDHLAGLT